ncbi:ribosomal RNA small subunit methyltransferase A [Candidatus Marinamargulisbacteria bacterium SCGC AG-343-K17]|nr:ribosomal RNA small subunit methyltransferase A [Candidatus Marinamargulisbacteria bacterium SCGC AG-343-K17]
MKQHTKTLGQVFLHDQNIINKIITLSNPSPNKPIIEIGCGKGILTKALSNIGPTHVIEIDERWIKHVSDLKLKNVTFTQKDALKVDYSSLPKGAPVIANIPYQITSPLIETLSEVKHHLGPITIMIQKEMADRLLAKKNTKTYGSMTIFCNYHFTITKGFNVSRHCFTPEPNVDSSVIQLTAKNDVFSESDAALFFAMTRSFFWGRRKTMINCLLNSPHLHCKPTIKSNKQLSNILSKRGESLGLEEHQQLFNDIKPYISHPN